MLSASLSFLICLLLLINMLCCMLERANALIASAPSARHAGLMLCMSRQSSLADADNVENVEKILQSKFPEATAAECTRFTTAFGKGNAGKRRDVIERKMREYLNWRKRYGLDNYQRPFDDDAACWEFAVKKAWKDEMKDHENVDSKKLDQVIFLHSTSGEDGTHCIRDYNNKRILHLLPARINPKLATSKIYANAIAFYLDQQLNRQSLERLTVLFDVRGGDGWPNPPGFTMMKFITSSIHMLQSNFATRLDKLVLFPLPTWAKSIFNACKPLLRSSTVGKVIVVPGPCSPEAPLPKEAIINHISTEVLEHTEMIRLSFFDDGASCKGGAQN